MFGIYGNNPQSQLERWTKIRQDADAEIQRLTHAPAAINQNFNIVAPSVNDFDAKFIDSYEEVKKAEVTRNTIFMNTSEPIFYMKMVDGEIKSYKFEEIVILDERDKKMMELENKINELMKGRETYVKSIDESYEEDAKQQSANRINVLQESSTNGSTNDKKKS